MILYHFRTSPYSRRVRLALAWKGLSAELRDPRAEPDRKGELDQLNPLKTVPVLVDGEHVVTDSVAIAHYLDRKVPAPPLWPEGLAGAEAFQIVAWTDGAVDILINLAVRYYALHADPSFANVRAHLVDRAQRALVRLADRVEVSGFDGAPLCGSAWSAADMAVFSAVEWLDGLPIRAKTTALAKQLVHLGWILPPALRRWAEPHRKREDVVSLGEATA